MRLVLRVRHHQGHCLGWGGQEAGLDLAGGQGHSQVAGPQLKRVGTQVGLLQGSWYRGQGHYQGLGPRLGGAELTPAREELDPVGEGRARSQGLRMRGHE